MLKKCLKNFRNQFFNIYGRHRIDNNSSLAPIFANQYLWVKSYYYRNAEIQLNLKREIHIHKYSMHQQLHSILKKSIHNLFPDVKLPNESLISLSNKGDFQSNIAFKLSKELKLLPKKLAQEIASETIIESKTNKYGKILESIEVTAEAFLTINVNNQWLMNQSLHVDSLGIKNMHYDLDEKSQPKFYLIDHSSPNMSKELHVGHLRSILIGESLKRVLLYNGNKVETVSHVGDFGMPVGLVIAYAIKSKKRWALEEIDSLVEPSELSQLYANSKKLYETDKELRNLSAECVLNIQGLKDPTDENIMRIYNLIKDSSRAGFNRIYKELGVSIPEQGESFYRTYIPQVEQELKSKGFLTESNGALVCPIPGFKTPLIFRKSDSSWLYATTDLACLKYRIDFEKPDIILYVVDYSQKLHFEHIFKVAKMAGWLEKVATKHVFFGVVQDSNGQKLSSRDGTPQSLEKLLIESKKETRRVLIESKKDYEDGISRNQKIQQEKSHVISTSKMRENEESNDGYIFSLDKIKLIEEIAPIISINAIKYYELSQNRTQNYIFSFKNMLNFRGNTSFYIMYCYARIKSILNKAIANNIDIPKLLNDDSAGFSVSDAMSLNRYERQLLFGILLFPDIIRQVETLLLPNILSCYLFELAQKFHSFYEKCRIIESPNQDFRLLICLVTESILFRGLNLLNVQVLEKI